MHIKTWWRKRIVTLLTGNTLAGSAVYENRITPNHESPWLNIIPEDETLGNEPDESSLSDTIHREQRFRVDICVKDDLISMPEDIAEEIGGQIEQLILTDEFLSSSAFGIDYEGSTLQTSNELEKKSIIYSVTLNVRGVTPRTNPFYTG